MAESFSCIAKAPVTADAITHNAQCQSAAPEGGADKHPAEVDTCRHIVACSLRHTAGHQHRVN